MPLNYVRRLTSPERTAQANQHLAYVLAFVAGATNAGGYLAVGQYTSHMSGIVSSMADALGLGRPALFVSGLVAVTGFIGGAASTALLVNFGRRQHLRGVYAYPLLLEACLLLVFGATTAWFWPHGRWLASGTVVFLCFIMGLQNAIITKVSQAEIRTTHVTGMITDIGIELGKMCYWNKAGAVDGHVVRADRQKLAMLGAMVGLFFVGGIAGAVGFTYSGFILTVPLAVLLLVLTLVPAVDDARELVRPRAARL